MSRYLLDTNICIAYFKGLPHVVGRFRHAVGFELFISEITLAELKYGAAKSSRPEHHSAIIADFLDSVTVLDISPTLDLFANEKARLARAGAIIADFDLLIGVTAIHYGLVLATNNTKHFNRLQGVALEDWML